MEATTNKDRETGFGIGAAVSLAAIVLIFWLVVSHFTSQRAAQQDLNDASQHGTAEVYVMCSDAYTVCR